jgi:hypothetical protein
MLKQQQCFYFFLSDIFEEIEVILLSEFEEWEEISADNEEYLHYFFEEVKIKKKELSHKNI